MHAKQTKKQSSCVGIMNPSLDHQQVWGDTHIYKHKVAGQQIQGNRKRGSPGLGGCIHVTYVAGSGAHAHIFTANHSHKLT